MSSSIHTHKILQVVRSPCSQIASRIAAVAVATVSATAVVVAAVVAVVAVVAAAAGTVVAVVVSDATLAAVAVVVVATCSLPQILYPREDCHKAPGLQRDLQMSSSWEAER